MLHRLILGGSLVVLLATSGLAKLPTGAHCRFNRQCTSRICQSGVCQGGPHGRTRKHPSGAPCRRNRQCASGSCSGAAGAKHCQ
jgi:hypothetical protein